MGESANVFFKSEDIFMIQVAINGDMHAFEVPLSLKEIAEHFLLDTDKIAIEHNGKIVPVECYMQIRVQEGDQLEIVHFIGGG